MSKNGSMLTPRYIDVEAFKASYKTAIYAGLEVLRDKPIERDKAIAVMYTVFEALDAFPTATLEAPHDWKPCAEGLPKNSKMVLTTQLHSTEAVQAYYSNGSWYNAVNQPLSTETVLAWMSKPDPYNPDQFREPTEMMQEKPNAHDKKVPPAKWCCGKPPIARYTESEIGLSRAFHTIKCQVCHSGVQVDIENYTDEAYEAALKHAVELWNEKVQHRPPMNSEICLPAKEAAE
jgi:hypothetical protein